MITFLDGDGEIVESSKDATRFEIKEFDKDGNIVFLSMGELKAA